MARARTNSKRNNRTRTAPALGIAGLSLAMAVEHPHQLLGRRWMCRCRTQQRITNSSSVRKKFPMSVCRRSTSSTRKTPLHLLLDLKKLLGAADVDVLQMRLPRLQMRLERLLGLWRLWWLLLGTLRLVVDEANNDKIAALHMSAYGT